MVESLQTSAQLTAVQEVDLSLVSDVRRQAKNEFRRVEGAGLTHLAFIARAVLDALRKFPQFNASLDESTQQVTYHPAVHLGVAVDTPGGLVAPVLRHADEMSVAQLAVRISQLAQQARANQLGPDELTGSTFTITNIGSAGSLLDTPIINPPEVAIIGTGAIRREPRVVADDVGAESITVRTVAYLPLTYDHRLIDGAQAGRFLSSVISSLEHDDWAAEVAAYRQDFDPE